jgi:16S rRNA (cytosine1402-N4)-methyltransferase
MTHSPEHIPVMLAEVMTALAPVSGETYVDATFGLGGYTRRILAETECQVIAFDRDPAARAHYEALPHDARARCTFIDAPFSRLQDELNARDLAPVDGVVFDLGVSSPQLDKAERGFSFRFDGPLDMRMDPRVGISASEVVNTYDEGAIADILYTYGEEKKSRRIARAIVTARKNAPIETTGRLASVIRSVMPPKGADPIDPCTRSFQALRIFVNDELDELRRALTSALTVLHTGGRLVVVTFHSLEDRIVKQFMTNESGRSAKPSRYAPITAAERPAYLNLVHTKVLSASEAESRANPRARSAKLRVAIRTATPYVQEAA